MSSGSTTIFHFEKLRSERRECRSRIDHDISLVPTDAIWFKLNVSPHGDVLRSSRRFKKKLTAEDAEDAEEKQEREKAKWD